MKPVHSLLVCLLLAASCGSEASEVTATGIEELRLPTFAEPLPGVYTAGQITENQFHELARRGYRHVLCLRARNEPGTGWEEARAKQLGVRFTRIEITGPDSLTDGNVTQVSNALASTGGAPAVVYCKSSNRVGAMLALHAQRVDGKSVDEALEIGKRGGLTRLEPAVRTALEARRGK